MASKAGYPRIPEGQWWTVRDQFKRTIPAAVTPSYLTSLLGVSEKTVRNLIPPLRQLGLIDEEGRPTARANEWRADSTYPDTCREMVAEVYPQELRDLFSGKDIEPKRCEEWFMQVDGMGQSNATRVASLYILLNDATPKASDEVGQRTRRTRKDAAGESASDEGPAVSAVVQPDTQPAEQGISAAVEGDSGMADYPYVFATKRLGEYFGKIQEVGQPRVADRKFLELIGFSAANDRLALNVWRFLGFTDDSGVPTERWSEHLNKGQAPKVLAGAIREAYGDLFHTYSGANQQADDELKDFFRSANPTASLKVVNLVVATFKGLCERADFSDGTGEVSEPAADEPAPAAPKATEEVTTPAAQPTTSVTSAGSQPTVHVNLQVHISPEAGPEQIDQIFKSMAQHLYDK